MCIRDSAERLRQPDRIVGRSAADVDVLAEDSELLGEVAVAPVSYTHLALVCFHREQPRARLIIDDVHECTPYVRRFEEILAAGGDPVSAMTLGL